MGTRPDLWDRTVPVIPSVGMDSGADILPFCIAAPTAVLGETWQDEDEVVFLYLLSGTYRDYLYDWMVVRLVGYAKEARILWRVLT